MPGRRFPPTVMRREDGAALLEHIAPLGHQLVVALGGIGEVLAQKISAGTPYESRAVILGHPQRGGPPSPIDRIMGLLFGARAAEAVANNQFGKMVSSRGTIEGDEELIGDGIAFAGVSKYPARVKCALLGWMAFKDAVAQASHNGHVNGGAG